MTSFLERGPIDHVALARAGFQVELDRCTQAVEELDQRIGERETTIARLQRQLAEERRERDMADLARRAAQRGISELDEVAR